eukprot:6436322-Amphidinium_carterae.2
MDVLHQWRQGGGQRMAWSHGPVPCNMTMARVATSRRIPDVMFWTHHVPVLRTTHLMQRKT